MVSSEPDPDTRPNTSDLWPGAALNHLNSSQPELSVFWLPHIHTNTYDTGDLTHPARSLAWSLGSNSASVPGALILKAPNTLTGSSQTLRSSSGSTDANKHSSSRVNAWFLLLTSLIPSWQMEKSVPGSTHSCQALCTRGWCGRLREAVAKQKLQLWHFATLESSTWSEQFLLAAWDV